MGDWDRSSLSSYVKGLALDRPGGNPDYLGQGQTVTSTGIGALFVRELGRAGRGNPWPARAMIQFRGFSPPGGATSLRAGPWANAVTVQESPWGVQQSARGQPTNAKAVRRPAPCGRRAPLASPWIVTRGAGVPCPRLTILRRRWAGGAGRGHAPSPPPPAELGAGFAGYFPRHRESRGAEGASPPCARRGVPEGLSRSPSRTGGSRIPTTRFGVWLVDQWRQIGPQRGGSRRSSWECL